MLLYVITSLLDYLNHQGLMVNGVPSKSKIPLPITYNWLFSATAIDMGAQLNNPLTYRVTLGKDHIVLNAERNNGTQDNVWAYVVTFGK